MSFGAQGTVTAFNFAIKLVQLPNMIVVAALATVAFPIISEYVKSGEEGVTPTYVAERFQLHRRLGGHHTALDHLRPTLRGGGLRPRQVRPGGDLDLVAMLTQIGLLFLPFLAVSTMLTALLNARKQTWLLLKVTVLSLVSIVVRGLPAVWLDRPDLSMIALPVFHGTLAIALSRSSGYRAFFWLDASIFKRTVVVALIAALALLANQTVNPVGNSWISALFGLASVGIALLLTDATGQGGHYWAKRTFDLLVGGLALCLAAPVLVCVALIIRATDPGSIFYRQERVGLHGVPFTNIQVPFDGCQCRQDRRVFDTAQRPADHRDRPLSARWTSLDELPQLFNVLRGDMSLVGPRPDVPAQRVFYLQEEFAKRHSVRPGVTGLAQVEKRSAASPGRTQKARPRICRQAQSRFRPADMHEDGHEAVRPERQLNPCAGSLDITTGRVRRWEAQVLSLMGQTIRHRGPDDWGVFHEDGVGLGNDRLSIIDVAGGHQPFVSEDGNVVVVQNGEIYNHVELAAELKGGRFECRTGSDTEVLLRLYQKQGISFVSRLNGMFVIAIYDRSSDTLYLIRDRIGVNPLKFSHAMAVWRSLRSPRPFWRRAARTTSTSRRCIISSPSTTCPSPSRCSPAFACRSGLLPDRDTVGREPDDMVAAGGCRAGAAHRSGLD